MKFAAFLCLVAAAPAFAAGPPLDSFCDRFDGTQTKIVWAAPSNGFPSSVRIFKVVPTKFSPETISNALELVGLTRHDKRRPNDTGVLAGKGVLAFEDREGTRHLDIIPNEGTLALNRRDAIAGPKQPVVNVPATNEALKRAVALLPALGLRKTEIVTNANGAAVPYSMFEQTDFHRDKASGKIITNVISRAVSLSRQIDGIPVWGTAALFAHFGNDARLADLTVTWRTAEPANSCSVPKPKEFVALIKSGRALMRKEDASRRYSTLKIEKARLYYWESDGSEHQTMIYPFAVLECKADGSVPLEVFLPFANMKLERPASRAGNANSP